MALFLAESRNKAILTSMKNILAIPQNLQPQIIWDFARIYMHLGSSQKRALQVTFILALLFSLWQASTLIISIWPDENKGVITSVGATRSNTHPGQAINLSEYRPLTESTWFGSSLLLASQDIAVQDMAAETSLNLSLKGTIMGLTPRAIIYDNAKSESHVLKEGEELIRGVTISQILRRRIMLNNKGKIEALSLPSSGEVFAGFQEERVITVIDNPRLDITKQKPKNLGYIPLAKRPITKRHRVKLSKTELISAVANLGSLSKEARFMPYVSNGKLEAFKIHKIQHDSFLKKLTLEDNDLLVKLDDIPIHNREKIFPMLMNMAGASSAELVIKRRNDMIALQIETD